MSYAVENKIIINTLNKLSPADRNKIFEYYTDIYTDLDQAEHMHELLDEHIDLERHGKGKIRSLLIWKLQKGMSL